MPVKRTRNKKTDKQVGAGLTAKQMRRKKPINSDLLVDIKPLTPNQEILFNDYARGKNIFTYGAAGTGKTFIVLYNAIRDVLNAVSYTHLTLPTKRIV